MIRASMASRFVFSFLLRVYYLAAMAALGHSSPWEASRQQHIPGWGCYTAYSFGFKEEDFFPREGK